MPLGDNCSLYLYLIGLKPFFLTLREGIKNEKFLIWNGLNEWFTSK